MTKFAKKKRSVLSETLDNLFIRVKAFEVKAVVRGSGEG